MGNSVSLDIIAVDSASNILQNIAGEFGALGAAAAAGIGLATSAFGSLLAAGSETQETMARFNSLVDSSPLTKMKGQMLELADATAKKTRFDNDSILTAEAQLAVYTSISEVTFPAALKATTNLAEYMSTDAPAAAKTLGRALEDIGNGSLSLLTKQKLLTKEQADTAKAMESNAGSSAAYKYELDNIPPAIAEQVDALQKAGNYTEAYNLVWKNLGQSQQRTATEIRNANGEANAQAYVLDILNKKMGGLAEDMANTFPGQITVMQNKFHDFWQEQGSKTEEVLTPLIAQFNKLGDFTMPIVAAGLETMDQGLAKVVQTIGLLANGYSLEYVFGNMFKGNTIDWGKLGNDISNGLGKAINDGIHGLGNVVEMGAGFLKWIEGGIASIDWKGVSDAVAKGMDSIDWTSLGATTGKGLGVLAGWWDSQTKALGQAAAKTDFTKLLASVKTSIDKFVSGLTADMPKEWQNAVKIMVAAFIPFDGAIQAAIKLVQQLVDLLGQVVPPKINPQGPGTQGSGEGEPGNSAGADFIVPPGYPNDSYRMRVESGEHVVVTPANRVGGAAQAPQPAPSSGGAVFNIGELHVHLPDGKSLSSLMSELGAAM